MKLDPEEKKLLASIERGEWRQVPNIEQVRKDFRRAAKTTLRRLRKDCRVNIRLSSADLEAIRKRADDDGLPYQTLISSVLHKYAVGRLREA